MASALTLSGAAVCWTKPTHPASAWSSVRNAGRWRSRRALRQKSSAIARAASSYVICESACVEVKLAPSEACSEHRNPHPHGALERAPHGVIRPAFQRVPATGCKHSKSAEPALTRPVQNHGVAGSADEVVAVPRDHADRLHVWLQNSSMYKALDENACEVLLTHAGGRR